MRAHLPLLALLLASCPQASDDDAAADDDTSTPRQIDEILAAVQAADSAGIDALMLDLAWGAGLPFVEGGDVLFLTRWDGAPDEVSLVSDVVGWEPGTWPATRSAAGSHLWVVVPEEDVLAPLAGATYKWHGPKDTWRAPPEATAYGFDEFGERGYVRPPLDSAWLERFPDFRGEHLDPPRSFRARLPAGFVPGSAGAAAMRTLLMHDGQNLFDPAAPWGGWRVGDVLEDGGWDDVVVLAVDSVADRLDVYGHVEDEIDGDGIVYGGLADEYLALLADEALPFFRERFGVQAASGSLAVAGSSMGGLVSLYQAMTRDGDQACVVAMSSTLGWGAFGPASDGSSALARLWPGTLGHGSTAIYLDSGGGTGDGGCFDGDGDGVQEDSDDEDNCCVTIQMRDVLAELGYVFEADLWHWHEPGAGHDEAAWAARLPRALSACEESGWAAP